MHTQYWSVTTHEGYVPRALANDAPDSKQKKHAWGEKSTRFNALSESPVVCYATPNRQADQTHPSLSSSAAMPSAEASIVFPPELPPPPPTPPLPLSPPPAPPPIPAASAATIAVDTREDWAPPGSIGTASPSLETKLLRVMLGWLPPLSRGA